MALEGDPSAGSGQGVLWAGTRAGGVVRWNTSDRSYVQFLKPQDGLAGNTVRDIYIDPQGSKWFATDGGLSVLDDNSTSDKSDDVWYALTRETTAGRLPSNHITAVAPGVDEAGNSQPNILWIGTAQYWDPDKDEYAGGGLVMVDTKGTPDPGDDEWLHTYTLEDTISTPGGEIILGLASNNITGVLPVPGNRVWVTTRPHLYLDRSVAPPQWQPRFGGLSRLDHKGTPGAGDDKWKTWNCENGGQFACTTTQIRMDAAGYVWVATAGRGVLVFLHNAFTLNPNDYRFTTADGLASNYIDAIAFGPADDPTWQNTVWISTYQSLSYLGEGVSVLNHGGTIDERNDDLWNDQNPRPGEPMTTDDGLSDSRVQAMVAGSSTMWLGMGGANGKAHGVTAFDLGPKTFRSPLTTASAGLPYNYITDLEVGQPGTRWADHVWIATGNRRERKYGVGVFLLDTHGTQDPSDDTWGQFTKEGTDDNGRKPWSGLGSNNVTSLAVDDDDDNVWFGTLSVTSENFQYTDGGLSVYDGVQWTNRTMASTGGQSQGLRWDSISSVAVGCQREVWAGLGRLGESYALGVNVLDPQGDPHNTSNDRWWSPFNYDRIVSDLITEIRPDCSRNRLLIAGSQFLTNFGPRGGGVGIYDYGGGQWTSYRIDDGLQSYTDGTTTGEVQAITVGPDGKIWAGTWGTIDMTRADRDAQRPYFPAVINWRQGNGWQHQVFDGDGWVSSVVVDQGSVTWIGTSRGGMDIDRNGQEDDDYAWRAVGGIHLTNGTDWINWTPDNSSLIARDIEVIEVAPDGDVWIGTNGWGLMRFHPGEPATPTPTRTSTPVLPTSTPTGTATPTATSTGTATPTPTSSHTPTVTQTSPLTSTPTSTQVLTATPTPTATQTIVTTPTATPQKPFDRRIHLPMVARNWRYRPRPTPTSTPTGAPTAGPQFACSGWCEPGENAGSRRQIVTSSAPVSDWRAFLNELPLSDLTRETSLLAYLDAPEGTHVRIEALYQGQWFTACDSVVECPNP